MQVGVSSDAQRLDAPEINRTGAPVGTVHRVTLVEEKLRKIRAVLPRDTGNDCRFFHLEHTPNANPLGEIIEPGRDADLAGLFRPITSANCSILRFKESLPGSIISPRGFAFGVCSR